jgi:hypothetical protein
MIIRVSKARVDPKSEQYRSRVASKRFVWLGAKKKGQCALG